MGRTLRTYLFEGGSLPSSALTIVVVHREKEFGKCSRCITSSACDLSNIDEIIAKI